MKILGTMPMMLALSSLEELKSLSDELSFTERAPVLFLGHGSPMNAIEDNPFVMGFKNLATTLTKPVAILCVSAHWYTRGTKVTAMEMPKTIHDFGGFPKALYDVQYPAKGSPSLAKETQNLLNNIDTTADYDWGLDHGAWTVIKHLYPDADVPVIQLSIDYTKPASYHFELAARLQSLRNKGILIIGSGNIIHNLGLVDFDHMDIDDYGYDWAIEAKSTIDHLLLAGDFDSLVAYQKLNKAVQLAIPTPDHYLPFIYTLGLHRKGETISLFNDKLLAGSLSMTSVKIG